MQENIYGEVHPVIDENKCVNCKLCANACHIVNPIKCSTFLSGYAAQMKDATKRRFSSSGGVAYILANLVLRYGGCIYSVCFDTNMRPIIDKCDRIEEFHKFQGSKYVQAYTDDAYRKIKQNLQKNSRPILFIGTPCQIAGLKAYLHKDYKNLYYVDMLCHAVVPYSHLRDEIESHVDIGKVGNCIFRSNNKLNHHFTILNKEGRILYSKSFLYNKYYLGFYKDVITRESCFNCKYATANRIGDLTIGDLLGTYKSLGTLANSKGISLILSNTEKGEKLIAELTYNLKDEIEIIALKTEDIIHNTPSMKKRNRSNIWYMFRKLYPHYGYNMSMKRLLLSDIALNYVRFPIDYLIYKFNKVLSLLKKR